MKTVIMYDKDGEKIPFDPWILTESSTHREIVCEAENKDADLLYVQDTNIVPDEVFRVRLYTVDAEGNYQALYFLQTSEDGFYEHLRRSQWLAKERATHAS